MCGGLRYARTVCDGDRVELMTFILASLAVYRLSRMITDEEGPFAIFAKLRGAFPPTNWVGRGLECIMCVSVWVASPGCAVDRLVA